MPSFGAYAGVWPIRFGGARPPLEHHVNSILAQLGTAYTKESTGLVWLRAMAIGRVVWELWEANKRLANQSDPVRMTDFLGRWEKILTIPVSPTDSLSVRRARVGATMARAGYADRSTLYTTCLAYLGASVFVGIALTSSTEANVWTPSGWPVGQHPTLPSDPQWMSTVSHINVLTKQPPSMSNGEWYTAITSVLAPLDSIMPAWVTISIARDGPHGAGFFLDEPDLDLERFRI